MMEGQSRDVAHFSVRSCFQFPRIEPDVRAACTRLSNQGIHGGAREKLRTLDKPKNIVQLFVGELSGAPTGELVLPTQPLTK